MNESIGALIRIKQSVVEARIHGRLIMAEQVWVGEDRLAAEVLALDSGVATLQVYEHTTGLRVGDPVIGSGQPFSVSLGPGLLGNTFDGLQRPLNVMHERSGIFIRRGERSRPLDEERRWKFTPRARKGEEIAAGSVLGVVPESSLVEHRILVPPGLRGTITELAGEGEYTVRDRIAAISDDAREHALTLSHRWPVRRARPFRERSRPTIPLITGQRVLDSFFPVARGGTAAVPGAFGSGKTVLQQSLAKWCDADIIVYVACGERGNETADVLKDIGELEDPWSGKPLKERTVVIANTSNMPVTAREASIYTGATIAEYFRDQGYHVALIADSTSRWAEALREISGGLGEMPAEEGFPAYLPSRLAAFYERAGRVTTLSGEEGSLTIVGAVSPPGGDFSEPVTRHTQRFTYSWWALDRDLADARHYPSVSWLDSYSLYLEEVAPWWQQEVGLDWQADRLRAMRILHEEARLKQLVELVGPDALARKQQWILAAARLLREGFLQQNAFHEIDAYTVPRKQAALLRFLVELYEMGEELLERGTSLDDVRKAIDIPRWIRLKQEVPNDEPERIDALREELHRRLERDE